MGMSPCGAPGAFTHPDCAATRPRIYREHVLAPASLDNTQPGYSLTRRANETDARVTIPASEWKFATCDTGTNAFPGTPSPTSVCLKGGFDPAYLYELVYVAKDPKVMGVGLATQYSAGNESLRGVAMQGAFFCVGLGALWVASRVPAHLLKQATPAIFALSLLPMVLVLFIGSGKYGNHWINLGFFNFQPSELAKLTLPMMLAWHFDRHRLPPTFPVLLGGVAIIAMPVGLTLLQHDLGTAMLVLAAGVFVLFLAGTSWWWWGSRSSSSSWCSARCWFPSSRRPASCSPCSPPSARR